MKTAAESLYIIMSIYAYTKLNTTVSEINEKKRKGDSPIHQHVQVISIL